MRPEELLKRCRAETISCHHADAECDSAVQLKLHYKYSTPFIRRHRDQPVNMLISALEPPVDIRGTARHLHTYRSPLGTFHYSLACIL